MQYCKKNQAKQRLRQLGVGLSLGLAASVAVAAGPTTSELLKAEQSGTIIAETLELEKRVHVLLDKAAQHIKEKGVSGVHDFDRDAQYTDRELYVFTVSRDGTILSSGGWSAAYIGQNVLSLTDDADYPFFEKMLGKALESDAGSVEYIWYNPTDASPEVKVTHFRVVDNIIIASGYFPGYSTEEEAKVLLDRAVSEYFKNPVLALRKFHNRQSGFRDRDQYVFVLDKTDRTIIWSPVSTELNDQPLDEVVDIQGKAFLADMVDSANPNIIQQIDFWWYSPVSKRVELRRAFYQQVGESVIGVGTYVLPTLSD